jgi:molecular chaperone GrpE
VTKKHTDPIDSDVEAVSSPVEDLATDNSQSAESSSPESSASESSAAESSADAGAEQEIQALAGEVARLKDRLLRQQADFENTKKRFTRERQEAEQMGMKVMAKGLLDALDDLGRFAHLDPAATDSKTVVDGAAMVEKKVLKSLAGHGLEVVNPVDAPFDPAFHEALTTVPAASKEEDHLVAQVYQVGYVFNGQLLRPARVVVKQWSGDAPLVS